MTTIDVGSLLCPACAFWDHKWEYTQHETLPVRAQRCARCGATVEYILDGEQVVGYRTTCNGEIEEFFA